MFIDFQGWVIFAIIIIVLAGFVQGVTSFGFALVSLPLLSLYLPLRQVVPLIVILSFLTNIVILLNCYKHLLIRRISLLVISGIAAVPIGSSLLLFMDETVLKIVAGAFIVLFAAIMLSGRTFPVRNEKLGFVAVGLTSGLLNGSISMSGPPVALFLSNQGADKMAFRANLTFYALILNTVTICTYFYNGILDRAFTGTLIWSVPAMVAGVLFGVWIGTMVKEAIFKKLILALIIVSGCWSVLAPLIVKL